ncbi:DUF222 domain-containing protein [Sinomonas sp. JGH33]|uniref:DUF222 domain-containing protein n=1 Tax=Sinomonas terricola TaxID=3110330 RepID=A0ABU5TBI2_9MICC|nr:DUF222 domain-containing protein [Sinomonas sp. JGH33]MEA5456456.1 DUF222 domain-containing protein [Sinomonas sp. JGH33]
MRFNGDVAHALAVSEIAVAECISEMAAARLMRSAESLCGPQFAVLELLEGGHLSEAHARVVTDETATLPESCAEEFGIKALGRLETRTGRKRTPAEFRRAVRALREKLHPESLRSRKARAKAERHVTFRPEPDGMCTLSAFLPAEVGLAAFNRLDSLARAQRGADPDDGRTLPQLRADALATLVLTESNAVPSGVPVAVGSERSVGGAVVPGPGSISGATDTATSPIVGTPRATAEVVVYISAAALLGASDEHAQLEGFGVIDADTARELAVAAPTWQRLITGIDGVPLALGRSVYRPPKALRRFIEYRDGTCQFPACSRSARTAEIDHMVEWQDGGRTDADNLQALCTKHHALKSLGRWTAQRLPARIRGGSDDDGEAPERGVSDIVWVSPLGGRAVAGPEGVDLMEADPVEPPDSDPPPF